jgi:RNA polymerase sigma factor (sigma-70 family)
MVGSPEQAQELTHDAFARLYERWERLDNPGAYLRTTVINGCRDSLRRRLLAERERRARRPDAQLGADHLIDALAMLPHRQRAAVVLRYYEDRSEADIANLLGVRPGTVKSLLSREREQRPADAKAALKALRPPTVDPEFTIVDTTIDVSEEFRKP